MIGLVPNRDVAPPFRDVVSVQGQAVVPVDLEFIGQWLRLLLGPPTTTGTGPDYVHAFVSDEAALPSARSPAASPIRCCSTTRGPTPRWKWCSNTAPAPAAG
jgi:hypothetical protein